MSLADLFRKNTPRLIFHGLRCDQNIYLPAARHGFGNDHLSPRAKSLNGYRGVNVRRLRELRLPTTYYSIYTKSMCNITCMYNTHHTSMCNITKHAPAYLELNHGEARVSYTFHRIYLCLVCGRIYQDQMKKKILA